MEYIGISFEFDPSSSESDIPLCCGQGISIGAWSLLSQSFSWNPLSHKIRVQIWCAVQVYGWRPWKIAPLSSSLLLSHQSVVLIWFGSNRRKSPFVLPDLVGFPPLCERLSEKQSWPSRTIGSNLSHKDTRQVFKLLSQKGAAPLVGADGDKSRRGQISILVRCQILSEISTRTIKYNTEFLDDILNASQSEWKRQFFTRSVLLVKKGQPLSMTSWSCAFVEVASCIFPYSKLSGLAKAS